MEEFQQEGRALAGSDEGLPLAGQLGDTSEPVCAGVRLAVLVVPPAPATVLGRLRWKPGYRVPRDTWAPGAKELDGKSAYGPQIATRIGGSEKKEVQGTSYHGGTDGTLRRRIAL